MISRQDFVFECVSWLIIFSNVFWEVTLTLLIIGKSGVSTHSWYLNYVLTLIYPSHHLKRYRHCMSQKSKLFPLKPKNKAISTITVQFQFLKFAYKWEERTTKHHFRSKIQSRSWFLTKKIYFHVTNYPKQKSLHL